MEWECYVYTGWSRHRRRKEESKQVCRMTSLGQEFEGDRMLAVLEREKDVDDDCTVVAARMPNECVLGLKNDCMMVAALNPMK